MILLLAGCGGDTSTPPTDPPGDSERHGAWRRVRLAIPVEGSDRLSIYDVGREEMVSTLTVPGASTLRVTRNGRYAFAWAEGQLRVLRAGVTFFAHQDHYDLVKSAPRLLDFNAPVARLDDVVSAGGWLTARSPAAAETPASVWALREDSLINPQPERLVLAEDAVDPGRAFALGDGFVRVTAEGEIVPVSRQGETGAALGRCTGLGAVAVYAERAALACDEGLLALTASAESVPVVATLGALAGIAAIHLHPANESLLLELDDGRSLLVQRDGSQRELRLPGGRCDVQLEPATGDSVMVLDSAGGLSRTMLADGATGEPLNVVAAFDCAAASRPRLGLAPERAYVSDPRTERVHDVDTRRMREGEPIAVDGSPSAVHVLGIDEGDANASTVASH